MTFFGHRVTLAALVLTLAFTTAARAQRDDSYTWKLGIEAGAMGFQTQSQSNTTYVPSVGAHLLIMAHRGGLMVGFNEGVGTDENATAVIKFNDIRRFQASLMAFPVSGPIEPYFGAGGGIMTIVGPRVDHDIVTDPTTQAALLADAKSRSATGFLAIIGGVQGRWKRYTIFAQYQATTSPADDRLIQGATQSLVGGIRIGLGSARDGVAAGGY